MTRDAIPSDRAFDVAMRDMKALGKQLERDHELAVISSPSPTPSLTGPGAGCIVPGEEVTMKNAAIVSALLVRVASETLILRR
jgi:hypothetical protein